MPRYQQLDKDGSFFDSGLDYSVLMKKHIHKHTNYLQPIFEAVSNALEATSENDSIVIRLYFSKMLFPNGRCLNSVEIEDTGCGFTIPNLQRLERLFDESKGYNNFGSGRIQYVHFFDRADIHTVYCESGIYNTRRIVLSQKFWKQNHSILWEGKAQKSEEKKATGTKITFYTLLDKNDQIKYDKLSTASMKKEILNRYLGKFCLSKPNNQKIKFEEYISDVHVEKEDRCIEDAEIPFPEKEEHLDVRYKKLSKDGNIISISKKERFDIYSYKLPLKIQGRNEVRMMSKGEAVVVKGMEFPLVTKADRIDDCYRLFLVSSDYITNKDSDIRGVITLCNEDGLRQKRNLENPNPEEILIDDLESNLTTSIAKQYEPIRFSKVKADQELKKLIDRFALDENVVKQVVGSSDVTPITVFKKVYEYDAKIKAEGRERLNKIYDSLNDMNPTDENFQKDLQKKITAVTKLVPEINRKELTEYTSKRKVILDLFNSVLEKKLNVQKKKKGDNSETLFHSILFPKKSDNPLDSNLWMINDDFIHYDGISEQEFKKMKIGDQLVLREDLDEDEMKRLNEYGRKRLIHRPDILLFPEEHKCIIIELKSLSVEVSKYIGQVRTYASILREFSKDEFLIDDFYAYLIGESFNDDDIKRAEAQFQNSHDRTYWYIKDDPIYGGKKRSEVKMYFEIVKYSTLLERARLRNKIFTDKISSEHNSDGNGLNCKSKK